MRGGLHAGPPEGFFWNDSCQLKLVRVCRGLWLARSSSREAAVTYPPPITPANWVRARTLTCCPCAPLLPPRPLALGPKPRALWSFRPAAKSKWCRRHPNSWGKGKLNIEFWEWVGAGLPAVGAQGLGSRRNKTDLCHYPPFHPLIEVTGYQ